MGLRGRPLTEPALLAFEASWESAGQRVSPLVDGVAAVAVIGDDLVATRAVAMGVARGQSLRRRVFLATLTSEDSEANTASDGEQPGVSDMIRYGISLGRAAQPSTDSPNLFLLSGGAESPLASDVLSSTRWRSLAEQIHRADALLLIAAPASVPALDLLLTQLDGALVVGDAAAPAGVKVLGEVQTAATMRTPAMPSRPVAASPEKSGGNWTKWLIGAAAALLASLAVPQVRQRAMQLVGGAPAAATDTAAAQPDLLALPPVAPRVTSDAAWSTEIRFFNSRSDALSLVTALGDTVPAPTFALAPTPGDSTSWYRVLLGAFSDSLSAENFLASLRARGSIPPTGGAVSHTPYALLVDSASDNVMARVRISGYLGRGLPAYSLRDSSNVWRIFVGAFSEAADANRYKLELDSLNIQSTLVVRVGSTS